MNGVKEELNLTKTELDVIKKELKNAKEEINCHVVKEGSENCLSSASNEFMCTFCDKSCSSKKSLKTHIQDNHAPKIKCKSCDKVFGKNSDLEFHIKENHDSSEKFECAKCSKIFVLEWRFKKHGDIHSNQNIRKCHYFNNQKLFPFEDIGCMFQHSLSGECKYGNKCRKKAVFFSTSKPTYL